MNTRVQRQTKAAQMASFVPVSIGLLQRKCVCGTHAMSGGQCADCAKSKSSLQRKLTIGASNDPLEREADRVAEQVLAAPAHSSVSGAPARIQRFSGQSNGQMDAAPASVDQALASPGRPLEPVLRQDMEQRFGHDFSQVRVHTDPKASESARAVNALAYTVGWDVVFGVGHYAPWTGAGRRLMAHELVHTVQQNQGVRPHARDLPATRCDESSERETDTAAQAIGVGDAVAVSRGEPLRIARAQEDVQPGPVARAKTGFYSALIESQRGPQRLLISTLRRGASALPQGAQGIVESIIDVLEMVTDISISLLLAIVALNVGVISGLVGLVESLFRLAAGLLSGIALFIAGIVTGNMGGAKLWLEEVYQSVVGIPAAFKALYDSWIAEFKAASTDRQTIMIGELFGQVIALLIPFLLSGGGAVAGRTAAAGEQFVGTTARARAVSAWGSADVIAGGGETTVTAGRGASTATRGALALEVKPLPVEVPVIRPVPKLVPPAPAGAAAPAGLLTGRTATIGAGVGASTVTRLAPDVLQEPETDEQGCRYEPIAMKFGRYPCHGDFAASLSGDRREFRVTTPEGISVDFDAMDHSRNLYEVKTGYGFLLNQHPSLQDRIRQTRERFINQSVDQTIVAERCGLPLRWYFNQEAVARDFETRIQPPVIYQDFSCDVDSDG